MLWLEPKMAEDLVWNPFIPLDRRLQANTLASLSQASRGRGQAEDQQEAATAP